MFTTEDFIKLLQSQQIGLQSKDISQYRYAVYVRKSTDDPERQTRSLGDQIADCKKLAKDKNLTVVTLIKEKVSAKESDKRPQFKQLIDDLNKGQYDAIISWSPDRLSRNMKEGGMIIDLIDKGIIKDLKFCNFSFENTTAGKMLLGISFVLSKQYSDQLSDAVTRGTSHKTFEGKTHVVKLGYYVDKNFRLCNDGNNFNLIKQAWIMRLDKTNTLEVISQYLNDNNLSKATNHGKKRALFRMTVKRLSELFKDSVYCGGAGSW
jgi:DNA invertase Pin-like site-specific DNA recombinase